MSSLFEDIARDTRAAGFDTIMGEPVTLSRTGCADQTVTATFRRPLRDNTINGREEMANVTAWHNVFDLARDEVGADFEPAQGDIITRDDGSSYEVVEVRPLLTGWKLYCWEVAI